MAIIIKALGADTITASGTTTAYTVPASKSAVVKNIRLVNGNTSDTPALNLFVKPSGTPSPMHIHTMDFIIPASTTLVIGDVVTLGQVTRFRSSSHRHRIWGT